MTTTLHPGATDLLVESVVDESDPTLYAVMSAVRDAARGHVDPGEDGWVRAIEDLRRAVESSFEEIDTGINGRNPAVLGEICHLRSKKSRWALLLMLLVRRLRPTSVLELGTCLGISGAYLGAGLHLNGRGRLVTLEGAAALAERSRRHFSELGLGQIDTVPGVFRTTLDPALRDLGRVDLAFIDGHHDEHATQEYFEQMLSTLTDPAVVVFDDIAWSDGMGRAWEAIRQHPAVRATVDLKRVGICVVGGDGPRRHIDLAPLDAAIPERTDAPARGGDEHLRVLPIARLNLGCGARGEPGWVNADLRSGPGVQLVGDVRNGLPISNDRLDYVVSVHTLPMIALPDLRPLLRDVRRVLKPGGVVRLGLPDLSRAVTAWQASDRDYFAIPDEDARSLSAKLITQLLWYGHSVTLFTPEFAEELLLEAGFSRVHHCRYQQSVTGLPGITDLDNRERETFYVEAVR